MRQSKVLGNKQFKLSDWGDKIRSIYSIQLNRKAVSFSCFLGVILTCFFSLSFTSHAQFGIGGGGGNDAVFPDLGDIQKRYNTQSLSALTNDFAGDQIDIDTGALSFTVTDVSIPGNNNLSVAFTRSLSRDYSGERWGDWNIGIPSLSRNYVSQIGNNLDRCTGQLTPDPIIEAGAFVPVPAGSYWHGYNLKIPGRSPGKLGGYGQGGGSAEFAGANARMVTKNNWVLRCGVSADDGGEGYEVQAPNGDIYTFDRVTTRPVRQFSVGYHDPSGPQSQSNPYAPNASADFSMMEETLLASEVRDVHGNTVTYSNTGITSSDGRSISFGGTASQKTVTANGRIWTYTISGGKLTQVTLPDGRKWTYTTPSYWHEEGTTGTCAYHNATTLSPVIVTHPSGAQVQFDKTVIRNGRTHMDVVLSDPGSPDPSVEQCHIGVNYYVTSSGFYSWAVTDKTITLPGQAAYSYNWDYEQDYGSYNNSSTHPADTKKRTVTDPLGYKTVYYFNRRNGVLEGSLEKVEIIPSGTSTAAQTTTNTFLAGHMVGSDFSGVGFGQLSNGVSTRRLYKTSTVTQRDGDTFTTNWVFETDPSHAEFAYNSPKSVSVHSNVSQTPRTTVTEYEHKKPNWILSLPSTVTQNGRELATYTYNNEGLKTAQSRYNQLVFAEFDYNADGTLAWYKDALDRTTIAQNWKRGTPQKVIRPDLSEYEQTVDNNGWLTSYEDPMNRVTSYNHDDMGRVTLVDPHGAWDNTSINYSFPSSGGAVQTVTIGQSKTTITYDGLFRPTLELTQALDTGWSSYVNTSYDALSRPIFKSQPSLSPSETKGVETEYDGLGRVETTKETVAPFATTSHSYHSGHRHRVTDPSGAWTDYISYGYDGPGNKDYHGIRHSSGQLTYLYKNIHGQLERLQQAGPVPAGGLISKNQYLRYDARQNVCRYTTVEGRDTIYKHDDAGQVIAYQKGVPYSAACAEPTGTAKVSLEYDLLGRLKNTLFADSGTAHPTPDIFRTYDANGNLKTVNRGVGTNTVDWSYDYNDADLLTSEILHIDGQTFPLGYSYNSSKHVTQRSYPNGFHTSFEPDGLGRARAAKFGTNNYASGALFHPSGTVKQFTYGNGQNFTQSLNNRLLPQRLLASGGGVTALDLTYTYDARAKVTSITDGAVSGNNRSFGYDSLGRLTSATGPWGNGVNTYDMVNNILTRTLGSRTITLNYNYDKNRVNQSVDSGATGTRTVAYDLRGNVTTLGTLGMVYDHSDQPTIITGSVNGTSFNSSSFTYDGNLKRVKSVINGRTIYNVYDASGGLAHVHELAASGQPDTRTDYVKLGGMAIARVENQTTPIYSYSDHLGSPVTSINGITGIIERERYTPFGIAMDNPATLKDQAGFTGHIKDSATGLNYMQARYYDPVMGRFLSMDPVTFMQTGEPGMFNRYAYANNDPINLLDPDGQFWGAANKAFKVAKNGGDIGATFAGAVADTKTLFSKDATGLQKLGAAASLATEIFSPVSARDAKAGAGFVKKKLGGKCCFVAGTLVETEFGLRPIEEIELGDKVLARNPETGETALKSVTDLIRLNERQIWEVSLSGANNTSEFFETTDDHPWWIVDMDGNGSWKTTAELSDGMIVTTADNQTMVITKVMQTNRVDATYNLTVADFQTYFVGENKILVHNCDIKTKDTKFGVMTDMHSKDLKGAVGTARLDKAFGDSTKANCAKCKLTESIKARKADLAHSRAHGQKVGSTRDKNHVNRINLEERELKSLE